MENACWSSAFWKIRNHRFSFHKFLYIRIWIYILLIPFNDMVPDFSKSWTSARIFHLNYVTDLADSKTLRVVFYADSDAINRFEKFHRLEVLFPPRILRTILSIPQHRLCIWGWKSLHKGYFLCRITWSKKFFKIRKFYTFSE